MAENQESWRCARFSYLPKSQLLSFGILLGDVILYDGHLALYKHSLDVILYFIAGPTENELMINLALGSLTDALTMLLRNSLEKRGILENLDLVLLCLDETIDDGYVFATCPTPSSRFARPSSGVVCKASLFFGGQILMRIQLLARAGSSWIRMQEPLRQESPGRARTAI